MTCKTRRAQRIVKLIRALEAGGNLAAVLEECRRPPHKVPEVEVGLGEGGILEGCGHRAQASG